MSNHAKSAEQIELEIDQTRSDIDRTLAALRQKFSPGQMLDQALGYAKGGGADFAANIGRTVRDNPIPVTLLGVGLGWLMMSGSRSSSPQGALHSGKSPASFPRDPYGEGGAAKPTGTDEPAGISPGSAAHRVRESVGGAAETARSKVEALQETATERAHRAADKASSAARGLGERTSRWRMRGRERARGTRARAQSLVEGTQGAGVRMAQRANTAVHDHPLVTGLVGLALGAAIAAALPVTRRERELIGPSSDAARKAVGDAVREGAKQAKGVAEAAYEGAVDEARKRGLTPEAAREEAGRLAGAGAGVATAATRVAEREVRSPGEQPSESPGTKEAAAAGVSDIGPAEDRRHSGQRTS